MPNIDPVAGHYAHGALLEAIRIGVTKLGKTEETITIDDLAAVDEFHIGGREASEAFLGQLDLGSNDHVLDVGCGVGGTSRFAANRFGSQLTGIDLTDEFVVTGRVLCEWVGLDGRVALQQASALSMPFEDRTFDRAFMLHVGMNIADKAALCAEVHRVLKPGGRFGIYDIMRVGDGGLAYPVPWATTDETSAVTTPDTYRNCLTHAGFELTAERNRRDFALAFFATVREKTAAADGPPPLGLHILMGETAAVKLGNLVENVSAGRVAPVEMVATKPA